MLRTLTEVARSVVIFGAVASIGAETNAAGLKGRLALSPRPFGGTKTVQFWVPTGVFLVRIWTALSVVLAVSRASLKTTLSLTFFQRIKF